jgi:hypothetical protein
MSNRAPFHRPRLVERHPRSRSAAAARIAVLAAAVAALAVGLTVAGNGGHEASAPLKSTGGNGGKAPFRVFDNTQYTNVNLQSLGLLHSAIVEETPTQSAEIAGGRLPDRDAFERAVALQARSSPVVVLDFEDLYLQGSPRLVEEHLRILKSLARWARAAAPGRTVGFYGLLNRTDSRYIFLARQLAPMEGAFFPSLYASDDDRAQWTENLRALLGLAARIDPGQPVYPYLWPQYRTSSGRGGAFVDSSFWAFQLGTARRYAPGVVIWSKRVRSTNDSWITATARFMRQLKGG